MLSSILESGVGVQIKKKRGKKENDQKRKKRVFIFILKIESQKYLNSVRKKIESKHNSESLVSCFPMMGT